MGGGWPGSISSTTPLPALMRVANVEAYSSNPGTSSNPAASLPTSTYTANNTPGQVIIGAAGNDVFNAGTSSAIMTGNGLTNTYVWNALPTATPHITDFDPATDTINIGGLLKSVGYTGTNPFTDGTITLTGDGHGGTDVTYNHNGASTVIVDLDNIATSEVTSASFITTGGTAGTSTGGTSTGGTTGSTGGTTSTSGSGTTTTGGTTGTSTGGSTTGTSGTGTTTAGPTLTGNDTAGQVLKATAPNATFIAGHNSAVMTEDGGSNLFEFNYLPWNAGQITNFNPTSDKIDVSQILHSVGYVGTNPFSDGTLTLTSDGHGGTNLTYVPPGAGTNGHWPVKIVDIDNVAASALHTGTDFITGTSSDSTGSTGGTTGTSGSGTTTGSTGGTSTGSTGSTGGTTTTPGVTLTANDTAGQVLTATTPNDTFIAGHNSAIMTGDGGSNTYVFNYLPWNAGQITNFNPASDKIDVSQILHTVGYTGTNPFGDHTLTLSSDGHGGTNLTYNPPDAGTNGHWPIKIVDIDHVAPSALNTGTDFITGVSSGTASATTTTGSGTTGMTLTANNTQGQVLTATTPNDTFIAGSNSAIMTEDGGSNSFVFNSLPWNAGQITNFNVTSDTINVAGILHTAGYAGTNPFGDGTLSLSSDGQGGSYLYYNPPGAGSNGHWPIKIVDIDHVGAANLNLTKNFILH